MAVKLSPHLAGLTIPFLVMARNPILVTIMVQESWMICMDVVSILYQHIACLCCVFHFCRKYFFLCAYYILGEAGAAGAESVTLAGCLLHASFAFIILQTGRERGVGTSKALGALAHKYENSG